MMMMTYLRFFAYLLVVAIEDSLLLAHEFLCSPTLLSDMERSIMAPSKTLEPFLVFIIC